MSLQESETREHLKDHPQRSESEASGPKSSLGLVSCRETHQGAVYGFGFSFSPEKFFTRDSDPDHTARFRISPCEFQL